MPVFRIMLTGKYVVLKTDEGESVCGFVRNEYVRAPDQDTAVEKARRRVMERVRAHSGLALLADLPPRLTVEEVEAPLPVWKLAASESFVFFPKDEPAGE